jgi:hypothetical protein
MVSTSVTSSQQFKVTALITGLFGIVYVVINAFVIGGDAFVKGLNDNLSVPLALITMAFAYRLWRRAGAGTNGRFLWGNMLAGWVFWAIAEILWAVFAFLGQEVPYPSWADFFWLVGYLPMGIGLFARVRSLPVKLDTRQQTAVWGISLGTLLFTAIFVLQPILQNSDPQRLLENTLNLAYPLVDLLQLIIVLYLFFAYVQGEYGFGWRLLLVGFIFHQLSGLIFAYASTADLYYPDSQANWISTLAVDVPYNVSYLFWLVGFYVMRLQLREYRTFELNILPELVPNAHILVFTKKDDVIIDVSHNFYRLFPIEDVKGKTLGDVLKLAQQDEYAIREKIRVEKKLIEQPVKVNSLSGASQTVSICGMAIYTPDGEYTGANFLLRAFVEDDSFDKQLTESEKSVVHYFLMHNITNENNEIKLLLLDYYLAQIKSLFNMALSEGGATMSQSLLDELHITAQKYGWQMQFNPQTILDGTLYPVPVLRSALPVLLETAKRFASRITDPGQVEAQLQKLHAQFGEAVLKNVERHERPD